MRRTAGKNEAFGIKPDGSAGMARKTMPPDELQKEAQKLRLNEVVKDKWGNILAKPIREKSGLQTFESVLTVSIKGFPNVSLLLDLRGLLQ